MTGIGSLVRIELRRNIGLWLALPLTVITVWIAWRVLYWTIWLWTDTSYALLTSVIILGPFTGALSAWVAGRERRHDLEDLLISLPLTAATRKLATWVGTAAWPIIAYIGAVIVLGTITELQATWGRPYLSVVFVGIAAIAASSAIGFSAGTWVRSRLTAPIVGITLYAAQAAVSFNPTAIEYLSPVPDYAASIEVFYHPRVDIHLAQIAWFIGVSGVTLGIGFLSKRGMSLHVAVTACAFLIASTSAVFLISSSSTSMRGAEVSYTPVCEDRGIPVCVHPAYEAMLPETATLIARLTEPIMDLPGAPKKAEQRSVVDVRSDSSSEVLIFELRRTAGEPDVFALGGYNQLADILARRLVGIEESSLPGDAPSGERIQQVIANWLLLQAGIPLTEQVGEHESVMRGVQLEPDQQAALDEFSGLDEVQQRAWLEDNYASLKAGGLTLDDLP